MPRGASIHIGLNQVDPNRYNGWGDRPGNGLLFGCINDANDMKRIADSLGYSSRLLTDSQATAAAVVRTIGEAAQQLNGGDTLLLTYSGHGGQVPDANGEETDAQDETWVLWDRMLLDDELYNLWAQFRAGVRVFVLSDSCHSGTVLRVALYRQLAELEAISKQYGSTRGTALAFRLMPREVQDAVFGRDHELYETAQWTTGGDRAIINASVLLISGCQDNQLSADGSGNGLFTQTLLQVWSNGRFSGNYAQFHREISDRMPPTQTPNLYRVGVSNPAFESEKPFTIGTSAGGGTGASRPTIQGPLSLSPTSPAPRFSVNPGQNRRYAVEVATSAELFDYAGHGRERTDDNFFGSWRTTPFGSSPSYPAAYDLPNQVWERLRRNGSRLYYRLWATDSPTQWINASASTPDSDAQNAPFIQLATGGVTSPGVPSIAAASSVPNGPIPPRFQVNPGPNRYWAVEVATRPDLLSYATTGSQRNDDNFFGSWRTLPFGFSPIYPVSYDLPVSVWDRLRRNAARLYYRLWATDSPTSWVNATSTTPDSNAATAPSLAIARDVETDLPETTLCAPAAY